MAEWTEGFVRESEEGRSATEAVRGVFGGADWVSDAGGFADGSGGSWSFDEKLFEAVLAKWEELRKDLEGDFLIIRNMMNALLPPSEDRTSNEFFNSLLDGLASLGEANYSFSEYVINFHQKLLCAKVTLVAQEVASRDSMESGVVDRT